MHADESPESLRELNRAALRSEFGDRLQRLCEDAGFTRAQLAKASGVSYNSIQRYESGETSPTLDKLCDLADALEVTVGELLGETYTSPSSGAFDLRIGQRAGLFLVQTIRRGARVRLKDLVDLATEIQSAQWVSLSASLMESSATWARIRCAPEEFSADEIRRCELEIQTTVEVMLLEVGRAGGFVVSPGRIATVLADLTDELSLTEK
ncbi:MAG: helix-turn-helix transcriptional regulator [Myxococcota bacterium]|nr:helix-turn-helix transcriptional regulator [Myxococcota bacterium]